MHSATAPRFKEENKMLECREITKSYGRKLAVDRVSFQLEEGKIYAKIYRFIK